MPEKPSNLKIFEKYIKSDKFAQRIDEKDEPEQDDEAIDLSVYEADVDSLDMQLLEDIERLLERGDEFLAQYSITDEASKERFLELVLIAQNLHITDVVSIETLFGNYIDELIAKRPELKSDQQIADEAQEKREIILNQFEQDLITFIDTLETPSINKRVERITTTELEDDFTISASFTDGETEDTDFLVLTVETELSEKSDELEVSVRSISPQLKKYLLNQIRTQFEVEKDFELPDYLLINEYQQFALGYPMQVEFEIDDEGTRAICTLPKPSELHLADYDMLNKVIEQAKATKDGAVEEPPQNSSDSEN